MRLGAGPDRLDSWKEIASYLKREVRTVQLWEKKEGLPVHRHFHNRLGTVFAFRSEIEQWGEMQAASRNAVVEGAGGPGPIQPEPAASLVNPRPVRLEVMPFDPSSTDPPSTGLAGELFCKSVVAETVAALDRLDPGKVTILHPPGAEAKAPSRPLRTGQAAADYELRWEMRVERDGFGIHASLVSMRTLGVAWARTFPFRADSGDDAPRLIADQIVQCLWLKIVSFSRPSAKNLRRESGSAREAYLRGRYFWSRRNEDGMRKAITCFRTAIKEDTSFALPYSGLADALTMLSFYEIVPPSEAMPEARRAALHAIDLDPALAEAHASLGDIHLHFDRDWEGADREYRQAIQCNPRYAVGYHWYANLLAARGQHDAARIAIMHALEIDPVSLITQVWAGVTAHLAHRFDDAILHYQSALELDPHFIWAHMYRAQALEQQGDFDEALREFETTIELAGGSRCVTAMKAHAHAIAGDRNSAQEILRTLRGDTLQKCMPSYDMAAAYAALGEPIETVRWLKRACTDRSMKLFGLTQDPRFDLVRHRSEFRKVVDEIGLARYSPLR
jgi:tetratricopeptide (TPR) repeat protein